MDELGEAAHGRAGRGGGCVVALRRFKARALTRVRALARMEWLKVFIVWYAVVSGAVCSNGIR